ncbi:MAG: eukaryotic-like serine/threonine-protein kinase [Blastocatellia bacterium]|jgi:non-specific serine/threonine protein kinase/serine/threonine-protein kinase|nr:eukaryotic-like serine/threonine-protein kinase [Blastocatellia bacterium]
MQILGEALERGAESRDVWVNTVCAGDEALRSEVGRLLARQKPAAQFLEESPLAAVAEPNGRSMIGERVGLYKITSEIGRGGMGAVYLAERDDQQFSKRAAVKLIKRGMDTDFVVQRFRNERQILANLDHPNIARLLDGGATEADLPYFIMEYVEGEPIIRYAQANKLATAERLKLFRTVCSAVQYAHQNLVIHRDLKPSNILVTKKGEPKLLDFGIAKLLQADSEAETELTATDVRVMTPEYASPEQIKGERITTSSDVYSLGVLLYELLTGHRPCRVKSRQPEEIARAICEQEPEKPSVAVTRGRETRGETNSQSANINPKALRGDLDNIVLKALRKEPARRYQSVNEFSEDIRRHVEGLPVIACKATLSYRASKFIQRNKIGVAAAAIILLTLIGGIIATAWEARRARVESARAQQRFEQVRKLAHSVLFDYHDQIAALPGSTKVREGLVKDSLEYLDNLSKDASNDTSLLREIAAAYEKVSMAQGGYALSSRGNVLTTSNLGDTRGAIENLNKALAIRERVFVLEPNNNDVRQELALCYERIGVVYVFNGPPDKAVENLRQATPILEELAAADPTNEDLQYALVDNYQGTAKALGSPTSPNLGDAKGALEYMHKAQPIIEKLVADHATNLGYQVYLAGLHNSLGWVLGTSLGRLPEALEQAHQALAINRELVKADPGNTLYRTQLANQLSATGRIMLNAGDNRGALEDFKEGKAIYEAVLTADPHDTYSRRGVALGDRNVAEVLGAIRDYVAALNSFHQAQQLFADLVAVDPANAGLSAQVYLATSRVQSQAGDLNGALDSALQGTRIVEPLVATSPTNIFARNTLAQLYSQVGASRAALAIKTGASKQTAEWQAAKDAYQKSLDIYLDMKSKGTLSGADAAKPDEVAKEIAKCDAVLQRFKAK